MILVTGGTGFVGREVVSELLELGQRVRLLVRNPEKVGELAQHPLIEVVKGDALKPETLPAAMAGVQAVIHLIGIITETSHVTYEQAHIEATRNVLTAAQQGGVTRWVQMTAIGTRPNARSRYHITKWAAEELVRASGLDWTIFRPSLIYGHDKHDRLLNLFRRVLTPPASFLTLHSFGLIDGGRHLIQPVSVREVARCFARAAQTPAAIRREFDLVGPSAMTWREMIFKVLLALDKRGKYEPIPLTAVSRGILALGVVGLPFVLARSVRKRRISVGTQTSGIGIWLAMAAALIAWRRTVVFPLPGELMVQASEPFNAFAPRELQPSEVLKMAREDNIGDPHPAAEIFNYVPETFEQGLKNCYAKK